MTKNGKPRLCRHSSQSTSCFKRPRVLPREWGWPEAQSAPALWSGAFVAFLTTAASMIAFINSIVAGTGVTLLTRNVLGDKATALAVSLGVATTIVLMTMFLVYQRWRYYSSVFEGQSKTPEEGEKRDG